MLWSVRSVMECQECQKCQLEGNVGSNLFANKPLTNRRFVALTNRKFVALTNRKFVAGLSATRQSFC